MSGLKDFSTLGGDFPSVVVTAVEISTSVGADTESTWKGLLAGESGIATLEDPEILSYDLPVNIGGKMKADPSDELDRVKKRRMSYVQQVAYVMSHRLWDTAGQPDVDKARLGVSIGTGLGGGEVIVDSYDTMRENGYRKVSPFAIQMGMPNGAAAVVGLELGARAGVVTPVSACASGAESIVHAWRSIVLGEADMVVTGGVEGYINPLGIAGFSMMRAMSTRNDDPKGASRPFDRDRDGFVFGEAAALLIIETEEHAKARGAKPLARLLGAGLTSDGFHMVAPEPEGEGNVRAMQRALQTAGLTGADIDHVNAHATATPIGDIAEAKAINRVIGDGSASVYAPKSALGHSIGAVGALEAALTVMSVRDGIVPPTLNYENPDPDIDLDIVAGKARKQTINYALKNCYGFGGHNTALVFGKY